MQNIEQLTEETQRNHIIEILKEANSYGLQWEVENTAIQNLDKFDTALEAYEFGFNEWVK